MNTEEIKKYTIVIKTGNKNFSYKPSIISENEVFRWIKYSLVIKEDLNAMLLCNKISIHSCILKTHEYCEIILKTIGIKYYKLIHKTHLTKRIALIFKISIDESLLSTLSYLDSYFENNRYPIMEQDIQFGKEDLLNFVEDFDKSLKTYYQRLSENKKSIEKIKLI